MATLRVAVILRLVGPLVDCFVDRFTGGQGLLSHRKDDGENAIRDRNGRTKVAEKEVSVLIGNLISSRDNGSASELSLVKS